MKKFFLKTLAIGLLALLPAVSWAQTLTSYSFATGVDATKWVTLSSSTQILASGSGDGNASSVANIGFTFNFAGTNYTQFSVNTDGNLRFGATATSTGAYSTPFSSSNAATNSPKINAFGADGQIGASGYVRYQLFGTAPNRILVVEYAANKYTYTGVANYDDVCWQIQLFETTNKVLIVYSSTAPTADAIPATFQVGMASSSTDVVTINTSTSIKSNGATSTTNASSNWPAPGRYYEFTQPSCVAPSGLSASDITTTSATISWTASSTATEYQYVFGAKGFTPNWASATTTSNLSADFTGLSASTEYDFYLRSDCGSEQSDAAKYSFITACELTSLPLSESFDTWTAVPQCWTKIGSPSVSTSYPKTGAKSISFYNAGLALPEFDADLDEITISFWGRKQSSNSTSGYIYVGVTAEDPANITTSNISSKVTQVGSIYCSSTTYYECKVDLSTKSSSVLQGKKYVVIYTTTYATLYMDDLSVKKNLAKPTNLEENASVRTDSVLGFTFEQTGSEATSKWNYQLSKSSNSWGSDVVASGEITEKSFSANKLIPGKTYYARVNHVLGTETSAWSDVVSATTNCGVATLPFEEDFANGVTACWVKLGSGTISGYQSLSLTNAAALLPEINMGTQALSGCQLNFKMEVLTGNTPVTVKVIAAPSREASQEPSTLPVVATFDVSSATTKNCEIFLSSATSIDFTTNKYLGLYAVGSGKTVYFDDVVLKVATGMRLPENIQISEITYNSAKVTFEQADGGEEWHYQLSKNSSFSDVEEDSVVTSTTINLSGLDSKTTYYFRIRQEMDEETHWTDAESFTTDCAPLQYDTIDFESFSAGTSYSASYIPECWTGKSTTASTSYQAYVYKYYSYARSGYNSLKLPGYSSHKVWMALPQLAAADKVKNVVMNFWARSSSSTKYTLKVGVMSDPEDQTTFTSVKDIEIGSTSYAEFTVEFNQYTGTGKYIAFMVDNNYGTFYVDDITLEYVTCRAPKEATVTNITTETATLNVGFNDKDWSWKLGENGTVNNVAAGTASADLSGLTADSAYSVFVKTRCGGEDGDSKWFQIDFRTACVAQVALGYTEDFADGITTCMKAINNATYQSSGSKYVSMSNKAALILPIFEATTDWSALQLSFKGSTNSTSAAELKVIAYDETVENLANQVVLASVDLSSSMSGVDVYLNEIADINTKMAGKRLGLYRESVVGASIDDIAIKTASQFKAPTSLALTADSETAEGASFTFEQTGTPTNVWVVEVATANSFSSLVKNDTITATSFTLTGLNMKTKYYVRVKQMNGTESSNYSNVVEFTTECGFFTMGAVDNLESYSGNTGTSGYVGSTPNCWTAYNESNYDNYKYAFICSTAANAHSGSKSLYLTCYSQSYTKKKTWMALPEVNAADMSLVSVKFWARTSYSSYDLEVGVMSDPTNKNTYEKIGSVKPSNTYGEYTIRFNNYTGEKKYIVFMNNATSGTFYIDDIIVSESACAVADSATASEITDVTAKLSITNATPNWNVVVKSGETVAFSKDSIKTAEVVATNLTAQTDYVAYITMNCPAGGESDPVEVKFTTTCAALTDDDVVDSVLYFQGFESGFDACETKVSSNTYPSLCTSSSHVYEGSKSVEFYNSNPGTLVLPPMNITWVNYQLSLYAKLWSGSSAQNIVVAAAADVPALDDVKKLDTLAVFSIPNATFAQYNVQFKDVDATKLANAKYIVLYTTAGDILVDNIEIKQVPAPVCLTAEGAAASDIAATSATISITNETPNWNIIVKSGETVAFEQDSITEASVLATGLSAETAYEAIITMNCAGGVVSDPDTISFTTTAAPCLKAEGAAASDIAATSATISITNATPNWNIVVKSGETTAFSQSDITTASVSATGLSAETAYEAIITMNCAGGVVSDPDTVTFTTAAAPCLKAEGAAASDIAATSATISITNTTPNWNIVVKSGETVAFEQDSITEASISATGLSAETAYEAIITMNCAGGVVSDPDTVNFTTAALVWTTVREKLSADRMYTTCLDKNAIAIDGAVIYEPESFDGSEVTFAEVTELKAGYGYMFIASKSELKVVYGDSVATVAVENAPNGMQGTLIDIPTLPQGQDYCGITNNHLQYFGANNSMIANRAYIVLTKVPAPKTNTPARRRVKVGFGTTTAVDNILFDAQYNNQKFIIDGVMYILNNNRLYNAQGQVIRK